MAALTERQRSILISLARYYLLSRRQIHALCYPSGSDGRLARRDLAKLADRGYLKKHPMLVSNAQDGAPFPVYFLSRSGCLALHDLTGDSRYLHKPTRIVQRKHLHHYLSVAQTQILLRQALDLQSDINLCRWFNEEEIVNYDDEEDKHFRLFTELKPKPNQLVCAPDAGFLIEIGGNRGVYYLEEDRGSSETGTGPKQIAARKNPGYTQLLNQQLHRHHFPDSQLNVFRVLFVCPTATRRDSVRKSLKNRESASLWRFVNKTELTPTSFFSEPIWYRCEDDEPRVLLKV